MDWSYSRYGSDLFRWVKSVLWNCRTFSDSNKSGRWWNCWIEIKVRWKIANLNFIGVSMNDKLALNLSERLLPSWCASRQEWLSRESPIFSRHLMAGFSASSCRREISKSKEIHSNTAILQFSDMKSHFPQITAIHKVSVSLTFLLQYSWHYWPSHGNNWNTLSKYSGM